MRRIEEEQKLKGIIALVKAESIKEKLPSQMDLMLYVKKFIRDAKSILARMEMGEQPNEEEYAKLVYLGQLFAVSKAKDWDSLEKWLLDQYSKMKRQIISEILKGTPYFYLADLL